MRVAFFVVKFLLIGALFIISSHNLHLQDTLERQEFSQKYVEWIESLGNEAFRIGGYVVNSEWLPASNATVESNG